MNSLPGNPHFDLTGESIRASWAKTDTAPLHLQSAQVEATLALAFEQRTANLIAYAAHLGQTSSHSAMSVLEDQADDRLGLNGETND